MKKTRFDNAAVVVGAGIGVVAVMSAKEAEAGIAEIFAAVDLSTMAASVETLAITIIGVGLVFAGLKLAKRILGKA